MIIPMTDDILMSWGNQWDDCDDDSGDDDDDDDGGGDSDDDDDDDDADDSDAKGTQQPCSRSTLHTHIMYSYLMLYSGYHACMLA